MNLEAARLLCGEAGVDIADTHTEIAVGVVAICYPRSRGGVDMVEAVVDIVSREEGARILHGLLDVVICSQMVDTMFAMTVDCIGNSDIVNTIVTVVAMVHMDWIVEVGEPRENILHSGDASTSTL